MYNSYDKSFKLEVLELHRLGYSSRHIGCELGVDHRYISRLINRYLHFGESSLDKQIYTHSTAEFKQEVVDCVLKKCLSCEQVALHYRISESAVYTWVQRVKTNGYASLSDVKPRGRPPKPMGRPKKREPQTDLEKLRYEVEYLRTENALLKKVRALVEERIARESGKKPMPSKN